LYIKETALEAAGLVHQSHLTRGDSNPDKGAATASEKTF